MATETPAKATLQQRATHEIKELLILTAYLYLRSEERRVGKEC